MDNNREKAQFLLIRLINRKFSSRLSHKTEEHYSYLSAYVILHIILSHLQFMTFREYRHVKQ